MAATAAGFRTSPEGSGSGNAPGITPARKDARPAPTGARSTPAPWAPRKRTTPECGLRRGELRAFRLPLHESGSISSREGGGSRAGRLHPRGVPGEKCGILFSPRKIPGGWLAGAGECLNGAGECRNGAGECRNGAGETQKIAGDIRKTPGKPLAGTGEPGKMPGEPSAGSGESQKMHSTPPAGSGETQRTGGDTQEEHGVTRCVLAPRRRGDVTGSGERTVAR
jgi:hypothetical protein